MQYRIFILEIDGVKTIFNVDNDEDSQQLIDKGAYEIPQEQVKSIFGDYACCASNDNCEIDEDNNVTFNFTPPTPPSLDELKKAKLKALEDLAKEYEQIETSKLYFDSSLGFRSKGDKGTFINLSGVINGCQFSGLEKANYMDYDGIKHELSKEQFQTLLNEHSINGGYVYEQKWALQEAIMSAKSEEELNKIELKFKMYNFSQKKFCE